MNTIIEKIRAEVNRLKPRIRKICGEEVKIPVEKVREKFDTLLSFLSDLEKSEEPSDGLEEEILNSYDGSLHERWTKCPYTIFQDIARHFYELGRQSKPKVSEGLEEEFNHYCFDFKDPDTGEDIPKNQISFKVEDALNVACHFAKWGSEHAKND